LEEGDVGIEFMVTSALKLYFRICPQSDCTLCRTGKEGTERRKRPLTYKGNWKVYFFGTTAVKHLLLL
jgi:hypothetical protein